MLVVGKEVAKAAAGQLDGLADGKRQQLVDAFSLVLRDLQQPFQALLVQAQLVFDLTALGDVFDKAFQVGQRAIRVEHLAHGQAACDQAAIFAAVLVFHVQPARLPGHGGDGLVKPVGVGGKLGTDVGHRRRHLCGKVIAQHTGQGRVDL